MLPPTEAGARPRHESACLIVARNLGDAVIQSLFFRDLIARGFAKRYVVWTRPQVAFLYEGLPECEVVTSQFPVGTSKQFDRHTAPEFLRAAARLRRMRLAVTIDLIGDFRERLFARFAGAREHLHIGWAPGHPFARLIRNPFGTGLPTWTVPSNHQNVYAAHTELLDALVAPPPRDTATSVRAGPAAPPRPARIGVHPFASQDCRKWPAGDWTRLVGQLLDNGAEVTAFGADSDQPALEIMFAAFGVRVRIVTVSIPAFAQELSRLHLLVGLDSFSVHMAEKVGIASVMLNGASNPVLFSPPHAQVLSSSGGCAAWPCYNKPICVGGAAQYVCIRSIGIDSVCQAVERALAGSAPADDL